MEAPNFRQQSGKQSCCLIMASIAILVLPSTSIAESSSDNTPRIAQYTQEDAATNSRVIGLSPGLATDLTNHQGNNANITQIGTNNLASINQHRTGNYSEGNIAWLYQDGYNNSANISQSGGNNLGIVFQKGNSFSASINQSGNELSAAINQFGFNAEATINQFGSASQGVRIEQLSRSGVGMTVTVETR